jgi:hypothetical protein
VSLLEAGFLRSVYFLVLRLLDVALFDVRHLMRLPLRCFDIILRLISFSLFKVSDLLDVASTPCIALRVLLRMTETLDMSPASRISALASIELNPGAQGAGQCHGRGFRRRFD